RRTGGPRRARLLPLPPGGLRPRSGAGGAHAGTVPAAARLVGALAALPLAARGERDPAAVPPAGLATVPFAPQRGPAALRLRRRRLPARLLRAARPAQRAAVAPVRGDGAQGRCDPGRQPLPPGTRGPVGATGDRPPRPHLRGRGRPPPRRSRPQRAGG